MIETWRWFGTYDRISLAEIVQTGARGIVTALHEIPYGEVWPRATIAARKADIAAAPGGLHWSVIESLPVHEDIKRGEGDLALLFANYRQSLANLAAEGVRTVCYNFMPLLDWTRTCLDAPVAGGGSCLRFSAPEMAAFEIHVLGRPAEDCGYDAEVVAAAGRWADSATETERARLLTAIMAGLPGAFARYDVASLRQALAPWQGATAEALRANYLSFLDEILPAAEDLGIRLCVHPDDPPRPLLGLPRIVSSAADLDAIFAFSESPSHGLTLCSGSLGAHPDNDVVAIARRHASRIRFAHLRNVRKEADGSFEEAPHLDGDTDMVALVGVLLDEEVRRAEADGQRADIPFRPDHGHELLDDVRRGTHPGYPLVGRLRGLAELRGVIRALSQGRTGRA